MIKIIKEGTRQTKECNNCGCIFSFDEEDTEERSYGGVLQGYKKIIKCPQCKSDIILEATR